MEKKNNIKLPKLLYDIGREKALHPNNRNVTPKERDEAWARVANINGISLHETRSIFKVLKKKYDQEKHKQDSSWKLFQIMDSIHKVKMSESSDNYDDENEEFEMLEVQEDDDMGSSPEDSEFSRRSSNSINDSGDKLEKSMANKSSRGSTPPREERKVLNSLVSSAVRNPAVVIQQQQQHQKNTAITVKPQAILQHRGITLKKATPSMSPKIPMSTFNTVPEKKEKTTIQLPEAIKRKLNENLPKDNKKIHLSNTTTVKASITPRQTSPVAVLPARAPTPKQVPQPVTIKTEIEDDLAPGTVITLPTNGPVSTNNKNNNTNQAANGFTSNLQDIDFTKDIIFENHLTDLKPIKNNNDIIKLENDMQNQGLTPTFFKNLCNSSRHEAFGLYVANIMNRLSKPAAAKLEVQILRSVTNILSEDIGA